MKPLIKKIKSLQNSQINDLVNKRLKEFSIFSKKSDEQWFSELCFCILAANSKQKTSQAIQEKLNKKLLTMPQPQLAQFIRDNKHRFHNNKSRYIVEARKHHPIKDKIPKNELEARDWLIKNIKGLGMKEASHFLRNTGSKNLAILDRHILRVMYEHKIIDSIPKSITTNTYLDIEKKFNSLAEKLKMSPSKLDLFLWYTKTGEVLK